ncbi:hypothetical protein BC835DRAFT_278351 [Cytidiella melzeri]|nr:hypothetical protein BC835DRAFT_278351 [Cytidiella melzeri]
MPYTTGPVKGLNSRSLEGAQLSVRTYERRQLPMATSTREASIIVHQKDVVAEDVLRTKIPWTLPLRSSHLTPVIPLVLLAREPGDWPASQYVPFGSIETVGRLHITLEIRARNGIYCALQMSYRIAAFLISIASIAWQLRACPAPPFPTGLVFGYTITIAVSLSRFLMLRATTPPESTQVV